MKCFCVTVSKLNSARSGLTLSQTTNFRHFKTERICRRQFPNLMKMAEPVENTVGKGEIARYEQFLLFPRCFLKTCTADT